MVPTRWYGVVWRVSEADRSRWIPPARFFGVLTFERLVHGARFWVGYDASVSRRWVNARTPEQGPCVPNEIAAWIVVRVSRHHPDPKRIDVQIVGTFHGSRILARTTQIRYMRRWESGVAAFAQEVLRDGWLSDHIRAKSIVADRLDV